MKTFFRIFLFIASLFIVNLSANTEVLDINKIIKQASYEKKQTLIFFHMTHCGYCKRMEQKIFKDDTIKKMIKKDFLFIDINIDDSSKVVFNTKIYSKKAFANSVDVDFYPTVLFFDEDSEITYTARGYRKVKKFQKILEYITSKSFEKIDFFEYNQ